MKKLLKNTFSLLVFIVTAFTLYEIFKLGVLPNKYLYIIIGVECFLFFIVLGILFYLISIVGNATGYYYLNKTNRYIEKTLIKETYTIETKYYVVTKSSNEIAKFEDLPEDTAVEYYKYSRSIDKALERLGNYQYHDTDNAFDAMQKVRNENGYFLISNANYEYLFDSTNLLDRNDFRVLHEFTVYEKLEVNDDTPDVYNVYINGLDFTGIMRDYNLIASVNTKTRKVVLTSIPRDYYIDVPAYDMKDTLMCLGSLDVEVSKEALEKLFDIKIDYTINLNTTSLVNIVDTLGGVEFCSDLEFTTSHPLVLGTYDDTGKKLHVSKGCNMYNGIEILTIARERMALPGRDRYRQKNCRQILINIAKKLASVTTLTNYSDVLMALDGLYTTDMNDRTIKNLIKTIIENPNFVIEEQSVDGVDSIGVGHLGTQESWIMTPSIDTVNAASVKMKEVLEGK